MVQQSLHGKSTAVGGVVQSIDDDVGAQPGRVRAVHQLLTGQRLGARVSPVVNEQHAIAGPEHRTPHGKVEVAIQLVRNRPSAPPLVSVGRTLGPLADLGETDTEMHCDHRAKETAAGLSAEHHRRGHVRHDSPPLVRCS